MITLLLALILGAQLINIYLVGVAGSEQKETETRLVKSLNSLGEFLVSRLDQKPAYDPTRDILKSLEARVNEATVGNIREQQETRDTLGKMIRGNAGFADALEKILTAMVEIARRLPEKKDLTVGIQDSATYNDVKDRKKEA